jgi:hypothetical protein
MANSDDILALVKILLEIPDEVSWDDANLNTLITNAYRTTRRELLSMGIYFNPTTETIPLTSAQEYTLSTANIIHIISLYKGDYEYNLISPEQWPTRQERVYWWDKSAGKIKFFRTPEYQSDFTLLVDTDDWTLDDLDTDYTLLVALKASILIAASEKEKVDGLKQQYFEELQNIETNEGVGPKYVRQVENSSPEYGDI